MRCSHLLSHLPYSLGLGVLFTGCSAWPLLLQFIPPNQLPHIILRCTSDHDPPLLTLLQGSALPTAESSSSLAKHSRPFVMAPLTSPPSVPLVPGASLCPSHCRPSFHSFPLVVPTAWHALLKLLPTHWSGISLFSVPPGVYNTLHATPQWQ